MRGYRKGPWLGGEPDSGDYPVGSGGVGSAMKGSGQPRLVQRAGAVAGSVDQGAGGARGLQTDDRFSLFHHVKAVPGNQLDILRIALE